MSSTSDIEPPDEWMFNSIFLHIFFRAQLAQEQERLQQLLCVLELVQEDDEDDEDVDDESEAVQVTGGYIGVTDGYIKITGGYNLVTSGYISVSHHHHHHQFIVHFLPRLIKGMDGCFPTALGRQSTFSNILGYLV